MAANDPIRRFRWRESASEFELKGVEFRGKKKWKTPHCMDLRFVDDEKMIAILKEGSRAVEIEDELHQQTLVTLKQTARENNLKLSGNKRELIERIASELKRQKKAPERNLKRYTCLKCSPECNLLAYEFPLDFASNTQCRGRVVIPGEHLEKIVTDEEKFTIHMFLKNPARSQFVHVSHGRTYSYDDEPKAVFGVGPLSRPDLDKEVVKAEFPSEDTNGGQNILLSQTHVLTFQTKADFEGAVEILENGAGKNAGFKSIMEPYPKSESDVEDFNVCLDFEFLPSELEKMDKEQYYSRDDRDLDWEKRESFQLCFSRKLKQPDYSYTDSNFQRHINLDDCSEWARKCIQRWGLLPPFDPSIDDARWKLYYMERATLEWWNKANGNIDYDSICCAFHEGVKPIPEGKCMPWDEEFAKPKLLSRVTFDTPRSAQTIRLEVQELQEDLKEAATWVMDGCLHMGDYFERIYKRQDVSKMFTDGIYVFRPPIIDGGYDGDDDQVTAFAYRCYSPFAIGTSFDVFYDHFEQYDYSAHDHSSIFVRPRDILDCDHENIFQPRLKSKERFLWSSYALHSGNGQKIIKSLTSDLSPAQIRCLYDPVGAQSLGIQAADEMQSNHRKRIPDDSSQDSSDEEECDSDDMDCDFAGKKQMALQRVSDLFKMWGGPSQDSDEDSDEDLISDAREVLMDHIREVNEGKINKGGSLMAYLVKRYRQAKWAVSVATDYDVGSVLKGYFGMKQPVSNLKFFSLIFYMTNRNKNPSSLGFGGCGDAAIISTVSDFSLQLYGSDHLGELRSILPKSRNNVAGDPFSLVKSPRLQTTRPFEFQFARERRKVDQALIKIKEENSVRPGHLPVTLPAFETNKNRWVPKGIGRRSKRDYYSESCYGIKNF